MKMFGKSFVKERDGQKLRSSSDAIFAEEFAQQIQTMKRCKEAWLHAGVTKENELFRYAEDDFYFYRYFISCMERETPELLRRIVFRLSEKHGIQILHANRPIDFIMVPSGNQRIGYTFSDISEGQDVETICSTNHLTQIHFIRTVVDEKKDWYTDYYRNTASHKKFSPVSLKNFFYTYYDENEYKLFEKHLVDYLSQMREIIGYQAIKFLSSMNLGMQKLYIEKDLIGIIQRGVCYQIIDPSHIKSKNNLFVDRYIFPSKIQSVILHNFIGQGLYKTLLGTEDYAVSFVTSEWLYHTMQGHKNFDLTSIISGYLKSIEQLLHKVVMLNIDNGCKIARNMKDSAINAPAVRGTIPRYYFDNKKNAFFLATKECKHEYIDFTTDNDKYKDTTMGTYEFFLKCNPKLFVTNSVDSNGRSLGECITAMISCFRDECRNGYFHTHNLSNWTVVNQIRSNAILIYSLLLGGITIPQSRIVDLRIPQQDWFDVLCTQIRNFKHYSCDFVFEYQNGQRKNFVFDRMTNTLEYTSDGVEHYEQLLFFEVKDFSIETYQQLDAGIEEKQKMYLTRDSVPNRIWGIKYDGKAQLIYDPET